MSQKPIIVVGDGIAAMCFIYYLIKNRPIENKIYWYSVNQEVCSRHSTAVVALRGVEAGISPLGDYLVQGFELVSRFWQENSHLGLERVNHLQCWQGGACEASQLESMRRRFNQYQSYRQFNSLDFNLTIEGQIEQAYLFDPENFLNNFKNHLLSLARSKSISIVFIAQIFNEYEKSDSIIIDCSGHYLLSNEKLLLDLDRTHYPNLCIGGYYHWNDVDLGCDSFSLTYAKRNLIYRKHQKYLQLGTGNADDIEERKEDLAAYLNKFKMLLPSLNQLSLAKASYREGKRVKAKKRWPIFYESKNIFAINGLHKNGYTLAFSLGKKMADKIIKLI
jgi:hypothetical protein